MKLLSVFCMCVYLFETIAGLSLNFSFIPVDGA